ncbi:hypothetical protein SLE2022_212540 [Rubroshorea leprosula]
MLETLREILLPLGIMAKQCATRMVFFDVLMALALSAQAQPPLQNKVESHLFLQEPGYDEKKLEHYQHVFASTIDTDRQTLGGPNPIHNPPPHPRTWLKHIYSSLLS